MPKRRTKGDESAAPTPADGPDAFTDVLTNESSPPADAAAAVVPPANHESPAYRETTAAGPVGQVDQSAPWPARDEAAAAEPAADTSAEPGNDRRFRTWVIDDARGYCRMTDEQQHRLVVQFVAKPPEDVLAALKGAGFHFQPEYGGLQSVWVRRNDHTGRLQIESIEQLLRAQSAELTGPER